MRDKPHPNFRLEWPGGIVPEWARPQRNGKQRRGGKGAGPGGGKRERLQKVMAQSGYGSRRNIEILIAQGHVTINGQVAKLGDAVGPGDKVKLDGALIRLRYGEELPRVLLYHKPEGEIVTRDDPEGRATVFEKLPKVKGGRWVSVGRLDINTGGLLVFTTNGELANRLMHPRFEVEREYAVRLMGELTQEQKDKLLAGVDIEGESCKFDAIEERGGEGSNHWYHVVLREGKNREVRKMFDTLGIMVSRLMRVRFGPIELPTFLKRGQMKELDETQVQELLQFSGMGEAAEPAAEDQEDETDNIGNRLDYHANRERPAPPEIDGNRDTFGNRVEAAPEVDGNRGTYVPGAEAPRGPKPGRRAPGAGGGKFFKKRGAGGQPQPHGGGQPQPRGGGQPHPQGQRKHGQGKPHGQQGKPHGQGQPQGGQGVAAEGQRPPQGGPGGGKPGRNRRNKNRHRNRGPQGGQGGQGQGAQPAHGEPQPASNGNRDPY